MFVAVKIYKSSPFFRECALHEAKILLELNKLSTSDEAFKMMKRRTGISAKSVAIVKLLNCFTHSAANGNHCCLVLELLGPTLESILATYSDQVRSNNKAVDRGAEKAAQRTAGESGAGARQRHRPHEREHAEFETQHSAAAAGIILSCQEKIQLQVISHESVRLAVLGWQYRSALAKLNAKKLSTSQTSPKDEKEDYKGLSKKERKKLKKKHKKIEKNQKKKEGMRVIHSLVSFDPNKVKLYNVPSKTIRRSVWASYLFDYNRPKSLPPKNVLSEDKLKWTKSVRGTVY